MGRQGRKENRRQEISAAEAQWEMDRSEKYTYPILSPAELLSAAELSKPAVAKSEGETLEELCDLRRDHARQFAAPR